jgi:hypothetical protein
MEVSLSPCSADKFRLLPKKIEFPLSCVLKKGNERVRILHREKAWNT